MSIEIHFAANNPSVSMVFGTRFLIHETYENEWASCVLALSILYIFFLSIRKSVDKFCLARANTLDDCDARKKVGPRVHIPRECTRIASVCMHAEF